MPTKTISIELDVYEKLVAAKRGPSDSFSKVIRRTKFETSAPTGQELLERLDVIFTEFPDAGISVEEALSSLPEDPPVLVTAWDEVAGERGGSGGSEE